MSSPYLTTKMADTIELITRENCRSYDLYISSEHRRSMFMTGKFDDDTTISINTPGTNQITLSKPTINDLVDGEKISIAPASNGDRTLCCPPVDTSPPFTPTEDGLETTSSFPNLKIDSGDVKFDALTVTSSSITIDNYTAGDTSSKYLDLNTPAGNYKILCV